MKHLQRMVSFFYNSGNDYPQTQILGIILSNNLQLYYNFNEGSGTALADQSSNSNNGSISGAS